MPCSGTIARKSDSAASTRSLCSWSSPSLALGAAGIGLKRLEAVETNADWDKVAYIVLLVLLVVFVFDNTSNAIRSRLIGKASH